MMGTMSMCQPENWLYEIWQKGYDSPCYVMVPNAKDLVKSHLMIAVREEVEVLKEKISELMDKISQLEVENTILKANISQETLQQLQAQLQLANSATTGNNMITAAPAQQQNAPTSVVATSVVNTSTVATTVTPATAPVAAVVTTAAVVGVNAVGSPSAVVAPITENVAAAIIPPTQNVPSAMATGGTPAVNNGTNSSQQATPATATNGLMS